jgi:hypothetical protein
LLRRALGQQASEPRDGRRAVALELVIDEDEGAGDL